jgi:hypothetical protein
MRSANRSTAAQIGGACLEANEAGVPTVEQGLIARAHIRDILTVI